jgi:hypothetical protein
MEYDISDEEIASLSESAQLEILRYLARRDAWVDLDRLDPETRDRVRVALLAQTGTKGWRQ